MESLKKNKRSILRGLFFTSIVISLLISLTAFWLNRVFFNEDNLSDIVTTALDEQSSRDSIGDYISDKVFEDKPALAQVAGPRLSNVISSLLGTDAASTVIDKLVVKTQNVLTSDSEEDVAINLVPIKDTIVKIQSVIGTDEEERKINPENIPDEIVIIDRDSIPNFYTLGIVLLWLGPISLVYGLGGLGYWTYRGRKNALFKRIRISGIIVTVTSVIALLLGPLSEPLFLTIAREAPGKTLLGNLYEGLITPFNEQAIVILVLGVILIVSSYVFPYVQKKIKAKK